MFGFLTCFICCLPSAPPSLPGPCTGAAVTSIIYIYIYIYLLGGLWLTESSIPGCPVSALVGGPNPHQSLWSGLTPNWEDRFYTPPPPERESWDCNCARIETKASIHHPLWVVVVYRIGLPTNPISRDARTRIWDLSLGRLESWRLDYRLLLAYYIYIYSNNSIGNSTSNSICGSSTSKSVSGNGNSNSDGPCTAAAPWPWPELNIIYYTYVYIYIYTYTHTHTHTSIYIYIHTYIYIYIYILCIYIYIYIYTHMYIYIYTYLRIIITAQFKQFAKVLARKRLDTRWKTRYPLG